MTVPRIEIPFSKKKLGLLLVASVTFVAVGIAFVMSPEKFVTSLFPNSTLIFIAGAVCNIFFGLCAVFIGKKLFDKSPGLVISDEGIFDNASGVSAGLIPWGDILAIKETHIMNQRFINVIVKNPQHYIAKQQNALKRKAIEINYNSYGTVIGIPATTLQYKFDKLKALLETELQKHRK